MTVIISGSAGIQNPLGSAAAPSESNTTNSNTGAYFPTGTTYGIATNGSNALYIDASQNVGIGTTSPGVKLDVSGSNGSFIRYTSAASISSILGDNSGTAGQTGTTTNHPFIFITNATERMRIDTSGNVGIGTNGPAAKLDVSNGYIRINEDGSGTKVIQLRSNWAGVDPAINVQTNNSLLFATNGTERMRIDSSGNLLVGTTASVGGNNKVAIHFDKNALNGLSFRQLTSDAGGGQPVLFNNVAGTGIGSITSGASSVSYNTTSDYRLKKNVQPMSTGLATIGALKPVTYDWIADDSVGEGFIAHELQTIIPLAVTGEKDAVDDEGKPIHQGVDYSKIVVHLVAAIQELSAEVTALKAKVGA